MIDNHEEFKTALDYSRPAVGIAASVFTAKGFAVLIPPDRRAEAFNDRELYSDCGDMIAIKNGNKYFIEVKRITRRFAFGEWPFTDFIVDRCATFDKKKVTPDMYIVMSSDLKAYAAARKKNFKHMSTANRRNPTLNTFSPYYVLKIGYIEFGETGL